MPSEPLSVEPFRRFESVCITGSVSVNLWKSTSELGYVDLHEPPHHRADAVVASMAWNRHAIAQTQLRKHVASMAWAPEI